MKQKIFNSKKTFKNLSTYPSIYYLSNVRRYLDEGVNDKDMLMSEIFWAIVKADDCKHKPESFSEAEGKFKFIMSTGNLLLQDLSKAIELGETEKSKTLLDILVKEAYQ